MNKNTKEKLDLIANIISMAKSQEEKIFLLDDLLTQTEIDKVYERVNIVHLLMQNTPQRSIAEQTGSGIATVTRGSQLMQKPNFILDKFLTKAQKLSWWRW